jgi:hypothetical protein
MSARPSHRRAALVKLPYHAQAIVPSTKRSDAKERVREVWERIDARERGGEGVVAAWET